MSHFTVMVIGESPEEQLAPFQENNMGDCPEQFLKYKYNDIWFENEKSARLDCKNRLIKFDKSEGWAENPNAKWDWFVLGGRWSGMIKLKDGAKGNVGRPGTFGNETGIDQAKKGDIQNIDELETFAILKDGKWYERRKMGWWAFVSGEKDSKDWDSEVKKLLADLTDETMISIFDCHI